MNTIVRTQSAAFEMKRKRAILEVVLSLPDIMKEAVERVCV
jgi:hypothetical protein